MTCCWYLFEMCLLLQHLLSKACICWWHGSRLKLLIGDIRILKTTTTDCRINEWFWWDEYLPRAIEDLLQVFNKKKHIPYKEVPLSQEIFTLSHRRHTGRRVWSQIMFKSNRQLATNQDTVFTPPIGFCLSLKYSNHKFCLNPPPPHEMHVTIIF